MIRERLAPLLCVVLTGLASTVLSAEDAVLPLEPLPGDYVEIGSEMGTYDGVRHINIAAGNQNQQVNVAAISAGGFAASAATVTQTTDQPALPEARTYSALISDDAFAGSYGLTAVNIAAGSRNQQANVALIATGLEGRVATNAALAQTRASSEPHGAGDLATASQFKAQIDPTAFRDSSGIVQVSLIGGTGNASANVAVLSMEAGTQ